MLEGKRVVLGVSGGIAAYKAIEVGGLAEVGVRDGVRLVPQRRPGPLGSERAWTSLWDETHPIPHTHLGQTADLDGLVGGDASRHAEDDALALEHGGRGSRR